jgi:hypothetical protein
MERLPSPSHPSTRCLDGPRREPDTDLLTPTFIATRVSLLVARRGRCLYLRGLVRDMLCSRRFLRFQPRHRGRSHFYEVTALRVLDPLHLSMSFRRCPRILHAVCLLPGVRCFPSQQLHIHHTCISITHIAPSSLAQSAIICAAKCRMEPSSQTTQRTSPRRR